MKNLTAHFCSGIHGTAIIPGDKSISHRALMLGALANGETIINGLLESEDIFRTAKALISLGVMITPPDVRNGVWRVLGMGETPLKQPKTPLYFGNSGTGARLMMGMMAGYKISGLIQGDDSLARRPMGRVIKPLAQMGVQFETSVADRLPLRLVGAPVLRPIHYKMPVVSAQVKSAILLAALRAKGITTILETEPTRDHTERMLKAMGAPIHSKQDPNGNVLITIEGQSQLMGQHFIIPSDPSSAAFITVAALTTKNSDVIIPNVLLNEHRIGMYETLMEMGANITFENKHDSTGEHVADIHVKSSHLKGITVPPERIEAMLDECPIFAVAAAMAEGTTYLSNLSELRHKESDRLAGIIEGLTQAGITAHGTEDTLTIEGLAGKSPVGGVTLDTHLDHRMAMSFLVLGLVSQNPITIENRDVIANSFPDFVNVMTYLGATITSGD